MALEGGIQNGRDGHVHVVLDWMVADEFVNVTARICIWEVEEDELVFWFVR